MALGDDEWTQEWYSRLSETTRAMDAANGFFQRRWMALIGSQADEIRQFFERIIYLTPDEGGEPGDTSDLVNPETADVAWLDYMAQLYGVRVSPGMTVEAKRSAILYGSSGQNAGQEEAILNAARVVLTGTKNATLTRHYTGGDPAVAPVWKLLIRTRISETPDVDAVLRAVELARAKPAGALLYHEAIGVSWDTIEAARPAWDDWDGQSWTQIEETGLP